MSSLAGNSGAVAVTTQAKYNLILPTYSDGQSTELQADSRGALIIAGEVVHDAVDFGAPIKIGGKASSSLPSDVSAADRVDAYFDLKGRLIVAFDSASVPGTGATNLGKAEDAAHSSGDTGVMSLAVRNNTASALAGTDGDYIPLTTDTNGKLWTNAQVTDVVPGVGATNLGKAEDAVHASGDTGVMSLAVRKDTAAALAGTDGDYIPLITDVNGKLWVNSEVTSLVPGVGATNLGKAEDAAHTTGDVGVMSLGVRNNTPTSLAGTDGDYMPFTMDTNGKVWTNAQVTDVVPGTGATNLGKAEDAVHTSGDVGVFSLSVRKDTATQLAGTDGDYAPFITDASGRLHVNVGNITPGVGATDLGKAEDAAHTSGDTGIMALAVRKDTAAALAGTDGDYIPLTTDNTGRLRVSVDASPGSFLSVIDQIDTSPGPIWDTSSTTINGNAGAFVTAVAVLAAAVKKIRVADTTGRFIGVYTGAAASEALAFIINPGMDGEIEHAIAASTRISVRAIDSSSSITTGSLAMQFLG